jgi:hypothetical protein
LRGDKRKGGRGDGRVLGEMEGAAKEISKEREERGEGIVGDWEAK